MQLLQESLEVWKYFTHNLLQAKQSAEAVSKNVDLLAGFGSEALPIPLHILLY